MTSPSIGWLATETRSGDSNWELLTGIGTGNWALELTGNRPTSTWYCYWLFGIGTAIVCWGVCAHFAGATPILHVFRIICCCFFLSFCILTWNFCGQQKCLISLAEKSKKPNGRIYSHFNGNHAVVGKSFRAE